MKIHFALEPGQDRQRFVVARVRERQLANAPFAGLYA
jgi:hypothetical protein